MLSESPPRRSPSYCRPPKMGISAKCALWLQRVTPQRDLSSSLCPWTPTPRCDGQRCTGLPSWAIWSYATSCWTVRPIRTLPTRTGARHCTRNQPHPSLEPLSSLCGASSPAPTVCGQDLCGIDVFGARKTGRPICRFSIRGVVRGRRHGRRTF